MTFHSKAILLLFSILCLEVLADLEKAPNSFHFENTKKAVWSDFQTAKYEIKFDIQSKSAVVISEITLITKEEGHPIFDSVARPQKVYLNGELIGQKEVSTPGNETKVRVLAKKAPAGIYQLKVVSPIQYGVKFEGKRVSAGFFMKDMLDREFLERYIPSNLEYDQYEMQIDVRILGDALEHQLFTNGDMIQVSRNHFHATYPAFYTTSSLFFHLVAKNKFKVKESTFKSKDGRDIPVIIYSKSKLLNGRAKKRTFRILREMERDYGPWPHPSFILYANGKLRGGMEYAGAAVSGWFALGHEIQHAYFARAVMPQNGSSGWIDEGIASWRDFFHLRRKKVGFDSSNIGGGSQYMRKTDFASYKKGRAFMRHLDYLLRKHHKTRLKLFLKYYFEKRKYSTVSTQNFLNDLEEFSGGDFRLEFNTYIYGKKSHEKHDHEKNPYHVRLTEEELLEVI